MSRNTPFGSEPFLHFDLGVDDLASTDEIQEMHEPWQPGELSSVLPHEIEPLHTEAAAMAPAASSMQLPGMP